jgi:hypothetical protein
MGATRLYTFLLFTLIVLFISLYHYYLHPLKFTSHCLAGILLLNQPMLLLPKLVRDPSSTALPASISTAARLLLGR